MGTTTFSGPVVSDGGFETSGNVTAANVIVGGNTISGTELAFLDGVTAGTATNSKALVISAAGAIATITSATITTLTSTTIKASAVQALDASSAATIANSTGIVTIVGGLVMTDATNIEVSATTGTQIGTNATQKIGIWGAAPVAQQAATGLTTGFTQASGSNVLAGSTFTGNSGTKAYTISDIVLALKNTGIMAAS